MIQTISKHQLIEWLAKSHTNRVVQVMVEGTKDILEQEQHGEVLLLSAQWHSWQKGKVKGTLNQSELTVELNRIHSGLMYLINKLPDDSPLSIPTQLIEKADKEEEFHKIPPVQPLTIWHKFNWATNKSLVLTTVGIGLCLLFYVSYFFLLPKYYFNRIDTHLRKHEPETALIYSNEAIVISPKSSEAYNSKALCLLYLGRLDEAVDEAEKAINLDSKSPFPYSTLAQIYAEKGDTDKFYIHLEEALIRKFDGQKYMEEIGFLKYNQEIKFLQLLSKYKINN